MTSVQIETLCALIVTAAIGASGIARYFMSAEGHGFVRCIASAALAPLMIPRVGATFRRVLAVNRLPFVTAFAPIGLFTERRNSRVAAEPDGGVCAAGLNELAHKNARLAHELDALRAAYAELERDVAERAEAFERLHQLAYHDALTRLPNRVLLMDRLGQALAHAQRTQTSVLVMYLDLDNFKMINDTQGHAVGDRVLREIGARIARCMRSSDTASRIGGDEFVLVCPTDVATRDAAQIQARLQSAIGAPVDVDGVRVTTGASIGTALFPTDGADAAGLIDKADKAMYRVKVRDRDEVRILKRRSTKASR